jgi:hypothetical protein
MAHDCHNRIFTNLLVLAVLCILSDAAALEETFNEPHLNVSFEKSIEDHVQALQDVGQDVSRLKAMNMRAAVSIQQATQNLRVDQERMQTAQSRRNAAMWKLAQHRWHTRESMMQVDSVLQKSNVAMEVAKMRIAREERRRELAVKHVQILKMKKTAKRQAAQKDAERRLRVRRQAQKIAAAKARVASSAARVAKLERKVEDADALRRAVLHLSHDISDLRRKRAEEKVHSMVLLVREVADTVHQKQRKARRAMEQMKVVVHASKQESDELLASEAKLLHKTTTKLRLAEKKQRSEAKLLHTTAAKLRLAEKKRRRLKRRSDLQHSGMAKLQMAGDHMQEAARHAQKEAAQSQSKAKTLQQMSADAVVDKFAKDAAKAKEGATAGSTDANIHEAQAKASLVDRRMAAFEKEQREEEKKETMDGDDSSNAHDSGEEHDRAVQGQPKGHAAKNMADASQEAQDEVVPEGYPTGVHPERRAVTSQLVQLRQKETKKMRAARVVAKLRAFDKSIVEMLKEGKAHLTTAAMLLQSNTNL